MKTFDNELLVARNLFHDFVIIFSQSFDNKTDVVDTKEKTEDRQTVRQTDGQTDVLMQCAVACPVKDFPQQSQDAVLELHRLTANE